MLLRFIIAVLAAGVATLALGQPAQAKAQLAIPSKSVPAGSAVKAVVRLVIPAGYHAYPNPPSKDYMIPVKVSVLSKDWALKEVAYPEGKEAPVPGEPVPIRVYEGTVEIPVVLVAPKKPGNSWIRIGVNYQLCAGAECYPPEEAHAGAKLMVTAVKK